MQGRGEEGRATYTEAAVRARGKSARCTYLAQPAWPARWAFMPPERTMNYACVTLVSGPNYLAGVRALAASLRLVRAAFPLITVTPERYAAVAPAEVQTLREDGIEVRLFASAFTVEDRPAGEVRYAHWRNTFDKLWAFEMVDLDKLVFLDLHLRPRPLIF